MAFGQGSRSGLSYVVESTFGTTPGTPSLIQLPYTSHSLDLTKAIVEGNDLLPDRMQRTNRHGTRGVSGDINVDLRKGDYDPFFESLFLSSWSTNVLRIGTTMKYFSIEDAANNISEFRMFTGCTVNSMAISMKPDQMVTATMSLIGKDMTRQGTSWDATKTAASTNPPHDTGSGFFKIADAGSGPQSIAIVTGIDFTITNNIAPTMVIGSQTTPELQFGTAKVEGTFTVYYEDNALLGRFRSETETAIEVSVDDPSGSADYTWLFPRVKINGAAAPVENDGARIITLPFVALYDTTEATSVKLTRS